MLLTPFITFTMIIGIIYISLSYSQALRSVIQYFFSISVIITLYIIFLYANFILYNLEVNLY